MRKMIMAICMVALMIGTVTASVGADDKKGKVNLNTATKEQLVGAGIEEEIADGILELREENEEFVDIEELLDVDGITPNMLRQLKKKLFVEEVAGCNC